MNVLIKSWKYLLFKKKGQESLRKTFDSKIDKLRKDVSATIDDKIKAVKVDLQFACWDKRFADLEAELNSLKFISGLKQDKTVNNCELTVIATNLSLRPRKQPLDDAKDLISALGSDISSKVKITDASRCSDRNTGKPPLLKIAFDNLEQKIEVLRSKKT
jgi:hypothetical protein